MERLRIFYSKTEPMRYTGNLDVHKVWERTLRRARLPLAYSQGFHPQPRINQACPLPLGLLSTAEAVDIWLNEDLDPSLVAGQLKPALPPGLEINEIRIVDPREPSIPTQVQSSDFVATLLDESSQTGLAEKISAILSETSILRERRGKTYDLRKLIETLELTTPDEKGRPQIFMRLTARESATGRPDEVLSALGIEVVCARVERTALIYTNMDGAIHSPASLK
jgi:radical SAM-linked protein